MASYRVVYAGDGSVWRLHHERNTVLFRDPSRDESGEREGQERVPAGVPGASHSEQAHKDSEVRAWLGWGELGDCIV